MVYSEKYSKTYFSELSACDFRGHDSRDERDDATEETELGDTGDTSL